MERILVALDPGKTTLWAAIHGINLARRIKAKVYVLVVASSDETTGQKAYLQKNIKQELEPIVEEARSEGVWVDFYVAYGEFENEVVKFIKENKISLLIVGVLVSGKKSISTKFLDMMEEIRRRVSCRIEMVNEKGIKITNKRSE